jgi:hypothetical protein
MGAKGGRYIPRVNHMGFAPPLELTPLYNRQYAQ